MYPKDAVPRRRRPLLNQNRTQLTRSICPRPHIIIIDVADPKKKKESCNSRYISFPPLWTVGSRPLRECRPPVFPLIRTSLGLWNGPTLLAYKGTFSWTLYVWSAAEKS